MLIYKEQVTRINDADLDAPPTLHWSIEVSPPPCLVLSSRLLLRVVCREKAICTRFHILINKKVISYRSSCIVSYCGINGNPLSTNYRVLQHCTSPCLCTVLVLDKDVLSAMRATRVSSEGVIEIGLLVAFINCGGVTNTTWWCALIEVTTHGVLVSKAVCYNGLLLPARNQTSPTTMYN